MIISILIMARLVELFDGWQKYITVFCSSHVALLMCYIGYLNTARVCWLYREKEASHIKKNKHGS